MVWASDEEVASNEKAIAKDKRFKFISPKNLLLVTELYIAVMSYLIDL